MPNQFFTTLVSYGPRVVNRRDGSGSFTIHEFKDAQGQTLQARQDIVPLATSLIGQQVEVIVREEQKGNFLNRYLDFVAPANGNGAPTHAYVAQQTYAPQTASPQAPAPNQPVSENERQNMITRQTAAKVSAVISKTPSEFWQNCEDLSRYFQTGYTPNAVRTAETLTGQTLPPPHTDEDIPF